jgi:hypothetical protein
MRVPDRSVARSTALAASWKFGHHPHNSVSVFSCGYSLTNGITPAYKGAACAAEFGRVPRVQSDLCEALDLFTFVRIEVQSKHLTCNPTEHFMGESS